jgi:hypothetical protein
MAQGFPQTKMPPFRLASVKSFFPGWGLPFLDFWFLWFACPTKSFRRGFFDGSGFGWSFLVTGCWYSMDMDNWYSKSILQITLLQSKVTGQG